MTNTDGKFGEFELYPNNVLVHPKSEPETLVQYLLERPGGMQGPSAVNAAHACLEQSAWAQLIAMGAAGFDLAGCHSTGQGTLEVSETLLHRCFRTKMFDHDHCQGQMRKLIEIGVDPHAYNIQGISVMALVAHSARDMPYHRTKEVIELLRESGVRMDERCYNGQGIGKHLLDGNYPHEVIASRANELAEWAKSLYEEERLDTETPLPSGSPRSLRL